MDNGHLGTMSDGNALKLVKPMDLKYWSFRLGQCAKQSQREVC